MDSPNIPISALILSTAGLIYSIIVMRYRVKHEELQMVMQRLDAVEAEHRKCEDQQKGLRIRIEELSIENISLMRQLIVGPLRESKTISKGVSFK
jgi:hypothetical protein